MRSRSKILEEFNKALKNEPYAKDRPPIAIVNGIRLGLEVLTEMRDIHYRIMLRLGEITEIMIEEK